MTVREMNNIDIFNNTEVMVNRRKTEFYKIYILILSIFTIFILIFISNYRYDEILEMKGVVKNYLIKTYLKEDDLEKLRNNKILVNKEEYDFYIKHISEEIYDTSYNKYYEVTIEIKYLNRNELIDGKIINMQMILERTTILKQIVKKIKKGSIHE